MMQTTAYEVKVISFFKSPEEKGNSEEQNRDIYKCLGHFNYIEVRSLPDCDKKNPLERVWESEKESTHEKDRVGEYVLYALRMSQGAEAEKPNRTFIIISRFHCDGKINDPKTEEKTYVSELEHQFGTHIDMEGEFYDSLELGDIVVILHGNSLKKLFQAIQQLRREEYVKDSYSYCGFRADIDFQKTENDNEPEEKLDYASILYSIRSNDKALNFFEEVKPTINACKGRLVYLTGTADAMIDFPEGIHEGQIKTLADKAAVYELQGAFDEVITHIGVNKMPETRRLEADDKERNILFDFDKAIKWTDVCNDDNVIHSLWYKPLIRLVTVLRSMYNDCVMDDLAMILVPAVRALIFDISKAAGEGSLPSEERSIVEIIEEWNALMNQITHLEGQLYQQPELHTAHVYIPAMVLLFEQSFIQSVAEILNNDDPDNQNCAQFTPLLVPTLAVRSPQTYPYFDKGGYDSPVLIIKTHPELLYSPYDLSVLLCHELAHCCGVKLRDRYGRMDCLTNCISITIRRLWEEQIGKVFENDEEIRKGIQEEIIQKIKDEIDQLNLKPSAEDTASTGWINLEYENAVMPVFLDEELFENYVKKVITLKKDYVTRQEVLHKVYQNRNQNIILPMINHLCAHRTLLTELFCECYADIIMIILSGCDYDTYFRIIFEKEYEHCCSMYNIDQFCSMIGNIDFNQSVDLNNYFKEEFAPAFLKHIYRISFVIKAIGKMCDGWGPRENDHFECNWGRVAVKINQNEYVQVSSLNLGFPIIMDEIVAMDEYFESVAKSAKKDFEELQKDKAIIISRSLKIIDPQRFNWQGLRKQAENYEHDYWVDLKDKPETNKAKIQC